MLAYFKDAAKDITELSFSDCLESPDGVIARAEQDIAEILGAAKSHILTDGSTAGVYALVYLAKKRGGRLAIARNSHKSVYNACAVLGVEPYLLKTNERDGVLLPPAAADVEEAFKRENIGAVLVTTPRLFRKRGRSCRALARLCRRHGKLLLADGAHGAALRFDADEKESYAGNFADAWVDGAHKTLPTLTQGAILNLRDKALEEDAEDALNLFRTTRSLLSRHGKRRVRRQVHAGKGRGADGRSAPPAQFYQGKAEKSAASPFTNTATPSPSRSISPRRASPRRRLWKSFPAERCSPELENGRYVLFYLSPLTPPSSLGRLVPRHWRPSGGCVRCARARCRTLRTSRASSASPISRRSRSRTNTCRWKSASAASRRAVRASRRPAIPSWSRANRSPRKRRRRSAPLPIPSGSGKGRSPSSEWAAKRNLVLKTGVRMQLFENSRAMRMLRADAQAGRLSHAYLFLCPDARNLRRWLKELAAVLLGADARAKRLIAEECYSDCRIFPAPGEKAGVAEVKAMLDDVYIKPVEGEKKAFVAGQRAGYARPRAEQAPESAGRTARKRVLFAGRPRAKYSVLTTVRSRTKRLELLSFSEEETEAWLKEKFPARTDAHEIAALSGGILGKAEELAEGDSLTQEAQEAARLLSTLSPAGIPAAVRSCTDRQAAARLLSLLRLTLHDALAYQLGIGKRVSAAQEDTLRRVANRFGAAALVSAQEQITRAEKNLKFNANLPMCLEELFAGILEGR